MRIKIGSILSILIFSISLGNPLSLLGNSESRVELLGDTKLKNNTGYIKLSWQIPEGRLVPCQLQQASDPNFLSPRTIYSGIDQATFLSGLSEGIYFFRVRCQNEKSSKYGAWSNRKQIVVQYQSLFLAWGLFSLGAFVFLILVTIIFLGNRKYGNIT